jgi:hypothetical protein
VKEIDEKEANRRTTLDFLLVQLGPCYISEMLLVAIFAKFYRLNDNQLGKRVKILVDWLCKFKPSLFFRDHTDIFKIN